MSRALRFAPLLVFGLLVAALLWRLATPIDTNVSSKLVGRPLPDVTLGGMEPDAPRIPLRSLAGKPVIVNVFASWCVPCISEAPLLAKMNARGAPIVGIAVRDSPAEVAEFLGKYGNPYRAIGMDPESSAQIALGSSGVPESFIVDRHGIIRYQHIGPIDADDVPMLLAKLEQVR